MGKAKKKQLKNRAKLITLREEICRHFMTPFLPMYHQVLPKLFSLSAWCYQCLAPKLLIIVCKKQTLTDVVGAISAGDKETRRHTSRELNL